MSEEQTQETTTTESQDKTTVQDDERMVKESALIAQGRDYKAQLADKDQENAQLKAKLDRIEQDKKSADLASQGKWEDWAKNEVESKLSESNDLIKQLRADLEKSRSSILEAGLVGIENEYTRAGIISKCPVDQDPLEYLKEIQETGVLKAPSVGGTSQPAQGGKSGGSTDAGWAKVNEDYKSGIPDKVKAAELKLNQYKEKHQGETPPGDWS